MNVNPREIVLLVATASVALFGVTSLLARERLAEWRELSAEQQRVREAIAESRALVGERDAWQAKLDAVKEMVPGFPRDRDMTVHWMGLIEAVAGRHGLRIQKHQGGEERRIGDTYELPIEIRECEGSLEAFVRFLFDLQSQGAMVDVRYLRVKPKDKTLLTGRVNLFCAYTRE